MLKLHSRYWSDHTSESIAALAHEGLIAVLPVAATEQHGPHLPISTDTATIDGVVRATIPKLPAELPALFLPTCAYGKSNEHSLYPGTLTVSSTTPIALWMDIGASVVRSGVKKLVLFNSHGGQMAPVDPQLLLFHIWAVTQHYADYADQVKYFEGPDLGSTLERERLISEVTTFVLRGAGVAAG